MKKHILIADDDKVLLLSFKKRFKQYEEDFMISTAENGKIALEILKKNSISLIITDLVMPEMDGFALLAHISEHYPDIPVIVMTGHGKEKTEAIVKKKGAIDYIKKPIEFEVMAELIRDTLKKESEGGQLHNISLQMFAQMVGMEQKTCTIRITNRLTGQLGILFFHEGELFNARLQNIHGIEAAYRIFVWDQISFSIENACVQKEKLIKNDARAIILEAARRKEEFEKEQQEEIIDLEPIETNANPNDTSLELDSSSLFLLEPESETEVKPLITDERILKIQDRLKSCGFQVESIENGFKLSSGTQDIPGCFNIDVYVLKSNPKYIRIRLRSFVAQSSIVESDIEEVRTKLERCLLKTAQIGKFSFFGAKQNIYIYYAEIRFLSESSDTQKKNSLLILQKELPKLDPKILRQDLDSLKLSRSSKIRLAITRIVRDFVEIEEGLEAIKREAVMIMNSEEKQILEQLKNDIQQPAYMVAILSLLCSQKQ
ncbi:MAG: response regulator [Desulfobacterales bacterium]|nr:response regulator [Desulfobacterales bacterium]